MGDDERQQLKLNEIWHACRKIQDGIFRYGYDICADFCQHDANSTGLISEQLFTCTLGKYRNIVGLSNFEIRELTDYFRLRDGRVAYRQFCKVVCDEPQPKRCVKCVTDGLEWSDPGRCNPIPRPEEVRRLCLILIKIAQYSHLPLSPFFQDYELVLQSIGGVTVSHFSRVLHFMKIPLSDEEFSLLLKRYMQDSYLVNYVAFVTHIQNIKKYFKDQNLLDNAEKLIKDFPGRLIDLDMPPLPSVHGTNLYKMVFKNSCYHPRETETDCELIFCIQNFVFTRRVRVSEFLEPFDPLRTGTITKNQFERALHTMGVGKFLNQRDFELLAKRYVDPIDMNRVKWRNFEREIDQVFTVKDLDKMPTVEVQSPPKYIEKMARPGALDWNKTTEKTRNFCDEALHKIQLRVKQRRLYMHPFFRTYDKMNNGHVTCNQARQVFANCGIFLAPNELDAVLARFGNELGFYYTQFLQYADPAEYAVTKLGETSEVRAECPLKAEEPQIDMDSEEYIIQLLSNAKRQVVTKQVSLMDFLQDYDRHREGEITVADFKRGLDNANIRLKPNEVQKLCDIFRSPKRGCCVLYRDFIRSMDEIFIKVDSTTGDNESTAVPLIHLPNLDCLECFLNFDERTQCSRGLMKLARKPDEISNLSQVFQDFDRENCGTITKNQFLRALTVRDMHFMVSTREYEAIYKCFGVARGLRLEFNYREFLKILNYLHATGQVKRNY